MDFANLSADLESQPITGYLPDGRYIDIPLISHIKDNLYVGGYENFVDLGDFFSDIFSLYKWEKYKFSPSTNYHEVTMYDDPRGVDLGVVAAMAIKIVKALDAGGNVLVHCQAGINRSNLLAGTVLKMQGMTGPEAVALLREKRSPLVLANKSFVRVVLGGE